ncbi:hypothetical protein BGX28_009219 [Mortierella sp. GBA30]|nr:hypothetical protein BGX28_009219 [Mortierella sp. GBA30]
MLDTAVNIYSPEISETDEKATKHDGKTRKKRLTLNPAKAVIGGISQSANAVKGGISQVENGLQDVSGKLSKVPGINQGVSIFADYRKFLDRGNVIDLAVAVVIGAAFTSVVDSIVKDIIAPIVALASGKALEENFVILRKDNSFPSPDTVINFFIISACVFVIVKIYQMGRNTKMLMAEKDCPYCAGSIAFKAVRCSRCSSWLDLNEYAKAKEQKATRLKDGSPPGN